MKALMMCNVEIFGKYIKLAGGNKHKNSELSNVMYKLGDLTDL